MSSWVSPVAEEKNADMVNEISDDLLRLKQQYNEKKKLLKAYTKKQTVKSPPSVSTRQSPDARSPILNKSPASDCIIGDDGNRYFSEASTIQQQQETIKRLQESLWQQNKMIASLQEQLVHCTSIASQSHIQQQNDATFNLSSIEGSPMTFRSGRNTNEVQVNGVESPATPGILFSKYSNDSPRKAYQRRKSLNYSQTDSPNYSGLEPIDTPKSPYHQHYRKAPTPSFRSPNPKHHRRRSSRLNSTSNEEATITSEEDDSDTLDYFMKRKIVGESYAKRLPASWHGFKNALNQSTSSSTKYKEIHKNDITQNSEPDFVRNKSNYKKIKRRSLNIERALKKEELESKHWRQRTKNSTLFPSDTDSTDSEITFATYETSSASSYGSYTDDAPSELRIQCTKCKRFIPGKFYNKRRLAVGYCCDLILCCKVK